jgi:predicted ABC-type ATPase
LFFWLQNVDLAIQRVKTRVEEGGHNIEKEVIKRRYIRGIQNLFKIYLPIVDETLIFDNSFENQELIAEKSLNLDLKILNPTKFNKLENYGN